MKLSIVSTLYRSESEIEEFCMRANQAAYKWSGNEDYEIILVNDGSPDRSLDVVEQLSIAIPQIKIIDLSKNFGHHAALMCGLENASGDFVFLIDSDLEESPEWLEEFGNRITPDIDVVYGKQIARKGSIFEKASGSLFWNLFRLVLGKNFPTDVTTARLMRKDYVNALVSFKERELFIGGLWFITGFNQIPFEVQKLSKGRTTYTLSKKINLLVDSVTSFTSLPLVVVFYIGFLISLVSLAVTFVTLLRWIMENQAPEGWTSLLLSIWLLSGIMISSIGIVGIYLSKVFVEVKGRPRVIIKKKINFS